jgi:PAS domain S-box-containing protein
MAPSSSLSTSRSRTSVRRATDAALRASEERRELAERATGIGVFDWDLAGGRFTWSSEIYRLHGLPLNPPATPETWLECLHPDDRPRIQAAVEAIHRSPNGETDLPRDTVIDDEYRVLLPDGAVRWIASRVRLIAAPGDGPPRLLGVNFDITERKRTEATLRLNEERFRYASEALAGFLYDWDPITNRLEWFGGTEQVLGFRLDEVPADVGWYESRVHPEDLPQSRAAVRAAFESGAPGYLTVYRVLHRNSRYVYVADRSRIIRDETGRAVRVLGGVSDISERRRLEDERAALLEREREARTAAEAAARARDEVLGIVSHDLGNPLSAIAMCASALSSSGEASPERAHEVLRSIQHSAEWMNRLIRDLLDVASIETGRLALELLEEVPGDLVTAAAELFVTPARDRGVALETRVAPDLPIVRADAARVLQGLANFISNALKFAVPGDRVTLCADLDPAGVRFAVVDTGPGIPADDLAHVFERYWQKRRGGGERGIGLGLAIVRGIAEAHGGTVVVESTPGQGSRFSFTIPAAA